MFGTTDVKNNHFKHEGSASAGKTGSALPDVVHNPEGIKGTGCNLKEWAKGSKIRSLIPKNFRN